MNIEHLRTLIEDISSSHNVVVSAAYGYRHGTREWEQVAEAIRREGDAIGRLASELPAEVEDVDPDEAREAARHVHWDGI